MPTFTCYRCNYQTNHKTSMYAHLNKNIKCHKNINSMKYNDDQIIKYSLSNSDEHNKIIPNYDYKTIKNTKEFIDELKITFKNKKRKCDYCNMQFPKFKDLEKHLFNCIRIYETNNINITNNTDLSNSNFYNININVEVQNNNKILVPFDNNWNTEHLDNYTKLGLFLSTVKYTKTLESLLENDTNKNVLIDNDSNTGIIYKGGIDDQFKKMNIDDIVNQSMIKLHNHLKEFHEEIKNTNDLNFKIDTDIINNCSVNSKEKFNNFKNNDDVRKNVTDVLTSIFNKYKEPTKNKYIEINENKNLLYF